MTLKVAREGKITSSQGNQKIRTHLIEKKKKTKKGALKMCPKIIGFLAPSMEDTLELETLLSVSHVTPASPAGRNLIMLLYPPGTHLLLSLPSLQMPPALIHPG